MGLTIHEWGKGVAAMLIGALFFLAVIFALWARAVSRRNRREGLWRYQQDTLVRRHAQNEQYAQEVLYGQVRRERARRGGDGLGL